MADTLQTIIKQAGEIVEAIAFDDCGAVVGGHLVGGLLSRQTIMKADALRLALDAHRKEAEKATDAEALAAAEGAQ